MHPRSRPHTRTRSPARRLASESLKYSMTQVFAQSATHALAQSLAQPRSHPLNPLVTQSLWHSLARSVPAILPQPP
eukprot:8654737-Alexandrium_andersonii.AAC.1